MGAGSQGSKGVLCVCVGGGLSRAPMPMTMSRLAGLRATPTPAPDGVAGSVTREQAALALIALAGGVAALRLAGIDELAYRAVWLRYQPRKSPLEDIERAYARAEYALEARTRVRRPDETVRQYAAAVVDEPFQRLARVYERAVYAETASEADADDAVELADVVVGS